MTVRAVTVHDAALVADESRHVVVLEFVAVHDHATGREQSRALRVLQRPDARRALERPAAIDGREELLERTVAVTQVAGLVRRLGQVHGQTQAAARGRARDLGQDVLVHRVRRVRRQPRAPASAIHELERLGEASPRRLARDAHDLQVGDAVERHVASCAQRASTARVDVPHRGHAARRQLARLRGRFGIDIAARGARVSHLEQPVGEATLGADRARAGEVEVRVRVHESRDQDGIDRAGVRVRARLERHRPSPGDGPPCRSEELPVGAERAAHVEREHRANAQKALFS
jgi:hypothetical protein